MALVEVALPVDDRPLPNRVREFLGAADRRVSALGEDRPAFIPSDAEAVYRALSGLRESALVAGERFCEWGSGVGVAAALAAMLGFESHAIEIDDELVRAGQELADRFELDVEHVPATFVPDGSEDLATGAGDELDWLQPGGADGYELLGRDPDEFDLVFVYPWPGEEDVIEALFERHAGDGAILLTYHGMEGLRARRAVGRPA
jgi:hypothetical protein